MKSHNPPNRLTDLDYLLWKHWLFFYVKNVLSPNKKYFKGTFVCNGMAKILDGKILDLTSKHTNNQYYKSKLLPQTVTAVTNSPNNIQHCAPVSVVITIWLIHVLMIRAPVSGVITVWLIHVPMIRCGDFCSALSTTIFPSSPAVTMVLSLTAKHVQGHRWLPWEWRHCHLYCMPIVWNKAQILQSFPLPSILWVLHRFCNFIPLYWVFDS